MRRAVLFFASLGLCQAAAAATLQNGGELAAACRAFAAQPEGYHKTPEGQADPCRKFLEGYFRTLRDQADAELKARSQDAYAPKPARPCVQMPDLLTYRDFAERIVRFDAAHPDQRADTAFALAQDTLEAAFPCPEPQRPR
jgi:CRISPR/Cas system-associated protein Cas10 (large subunit of type III CRISPR-Cas system)